MITDILVDKYALARFRRSSYAHYPKENGGICYGSVTDRGLAHVRGIYVPEVMDRSKYHVYIENEHFDIVKELIADLNESWVILGDIHTHCAPNYFPVDENSVPSLGDMKDAQTFNQHLSGFGGFMAVMAIKKKNKRFTSSLNFWPLQGPISHKVV